MNLFFQFDSFKKISLCFRTVSSFFRCKAWRCTCVCGQLGDWVACGCANALSSSMDRYCGSRCSGMTPRTPHRRQLFSLSRENSHLLLTRTLLAERMKRESFHTYWNAVSMMKRTSPDGQQVSGWAKHNMVGGLWAALLISCSLTSCVHPVGSAPTVSYMSHDVGAKITGDQGSPGAFVGYASHE